MGAYIHRQRTKLITKDAVRQYQNTPIESLEECTELFFHLYPDRSKLNFEEFDEIFGPILADVKAHFKFWSKGAKKVCIYELVSGWSLFSIAPLHKKICFLFDFYDFDHSGTLALEEITILLIESIKGLYTIIQCKQGLSSEDVFGLRKLSNDVFCEADSDDDSRVSKKEFKDWIEQSKPANEFMEYFLTGACITKTVESFKTKKDGFKKIFISLATSDQEMIDVDQVLKWIAESKFAETTVEEVIFLKDNLLPPKLSFHIFHTLLSALLAFHISDVDRSGEIEIEHELETLIWIIEGHQPSKELLIYEKEHLKKVDANNDGAICRTEWMQLIVDWHRVFDSALKDEFDKFDADHSRDLSRPEFNKLVRFIMERYVSHITLETLHMISLLCDGIVCELYETAGKKESDSWSWLDVCMYHSELFQAISKLECWLSLYGNNPLKCVKLLHGHFEVDQSQLEALLFQSLIPLIDTGVIETKKASWLAGVYAKKLLKKLPKMHDNGFKQLEDMKILIQKCNDAMVKKALSQQKRKKTLRSSILKKASVD